MRRIYDIKVGDRYVQEGVGKLYVRVERYVEQYVGKRMICAERGTI